MSNRSDAWTPEEDARLAEIVLDHIRQGRTQLDAFATAGNEFRRTPNACGFRWNGVVRKNYNDQIREIRLKGRKERDRAVVRERAERIASTKTLKTLQISVEKDVFIQMKVRSYETGTTMSKLTEQAYRLFLEQDTKTPVGAV